VKKAHMSLMTYGLWQLPIFGAFSLANILLSLLADRFSIKYLSGVGSVIVVLGLSLIYGFSHWVGGDPVGLLPGMVLYSLGYGLAATPLYRFVLFLTSIGKGSTAALINTICMGCLAAGIELGNRRFAVDGNLSIAEYAGWIGVIYFVCALGTLLLCKTDKNL
jgi:DHA1 family multidrug/chloramphenicol efflux transport protein-like MFS transporter